MSNVDIITSNIINELIPLLNEKVNNHLKEQSDYKLKYENLIKNLLVVLLRDFGLDNSSIKDIVNKLDIEINLHNKEKENITLEINEKKESRTIYTDDGETILNKDNF